MSIQVYGIFDSLFSLGDVSNGIASHLTGLMKDVQLASILRPHSYWDNVLQRLPCQNGFGVSDPRLSPFAGINKNASIGIYIGPLPIPFSLLRDHKFKIAFLVCERRDLRASDIENCNDFDLICTPSEFCKEVFVSAGVTAPIRKVLHGLTDSFKPATYAATPNRFTFFNTFATFAPPERKGLDELLECFCDVFSGDATTELVLRTHLTTSILQKIDAANLRANVRIEELIYDDVENYVARFSKVQCLVHPSKAEGFGLTPFHALACEVPVIAPRHTGMQEYLTDDLAAEVEWHATTIAPYGIEINKDSLRDQLALMRTSWPMWRNKLKTLGPIFRRSFAWPKVLEPFLDALQKILKGGTMSEVLSAWEG